MQVQMEWPAVAEVNTINTHQNNEHRLEKIRPKMSLPELIDIFESIKHCYSKSTARRLNAEYLKKLADNVNASITVKSLPTKHKGRPLQIGQVLDTAIQDYIKALHTAGGVVNTSIIMAAA